MSRRAQAQRRLAALRAKRSARGRSTKTERRRRWWLLLLLLPLLLCLVPDCDAPVEEVVELPVDGAASGGATAAPVEVPLAPAPRLDMVPRPAFEAPAPQPLPWIGAFRMQVAARSPRLAECFVGVARPGQIRWTASVEPGSGVSSDHVLEPMLRSAALSRAERTCVLGVLSNPPYRLDHGDERSTPARVGIVLEF
ncbi:MAG: hypothetical protein ACI8PZ_002262 [Myxococcota bacterium]|jgi:hypothetical protein